MSAATGDEARSATWTRLTTQLTFSSVLAVCRRHLASIVIWTIICTVLVSTAVYMLTPAYQATADLVIDSRVQRQSDYQSVMSGPFTLTEYAPIVRSETQVLVSPSLAARVIDQLDLSNTKDFQPRNGPRARALKMLIDLADRFLPHTFVDAIRPIKISSEDERNLLIENYLNRLSVANDGRSLTISVKFWANDPKLAATIANTHVRLYINDQTALKEATARRASNWIGEQLERIGADLRMREEKLRDFREQAGLVHAQGATIIAQQVSQVTDQLSRARSELAQRESMVTQMQQSNDAGILIASDVLNSGVIQRLRQQESDISSVLVKLESGYSPDSRVVQTARAQIADVRAKIAQETVRVINSLKTEAAAARGRVGLLSDRLKALQQQLVGEDRSSMRVTELERDIDAQRGVYRDLMNRQQQIVAQTGGQQADARIISLATTPRLPFYPNKPLFLLLGFVAASTSGIGLGFVLDYLRKGIDQLDEVEGASGIMHFHSVPLMSNVGRLPDHLLDKPMGEYADYIRSLRGDIMHAQRSPVPRVLALTSTVPGEGKTTVALSVARSMAIAGLNVLVIDCDLRRSKCADVIGVEPGAKGLIGVLQGKSALSAAIINDPRSSVKLLVAEEQASRPQDLLDNHNFQVMLKHAQTLYDFVILDTPPITAVSDAWLVIPHADVVALAVRWQSTSARAVAESIQAFHKRNIPLTGLFLNAVDIRRYARNTGRIDIFEASKAYYPTA